MVRKNISMPNEIAARMAAHPKVNWSSVALEAFEAKLSELEGNPAELQRLKSEIDKLKRRVQRLEKKGQ